MANYYINQGHFDYYAFCAAAIWYKMKQEDTEFEKFIVGFCMETMAIKNDLLILSQFSEVVPKASKLFMKLFASDAVIKRGQVSEALLAAAIFSEDYDSYGNKHKGFLGIPKLRGQWFIKSHPQPQNRVAVFYESFPRYIQLGLSKRLTTLTS